MKTASQEFPGIAQFYQEEYEGQFSIASRRGYHTLDLFVVVKGTTASYKVVSAGKTVYDGPSVHEAALAYDAASNAKKNDA